MISNVLFHPMPALSHQPYSQYCYENGSGTRTTKAVHFSCHAIQVLSASGFTLFTRNFLIPVRIAFSFQPLYGSMWVKLV